MPRNGGRVRWVVLVHSSRGLQVHGPFVRDVAEREATNVNERSAELGVDVHASIFYAHAGPIAVSDYGLARRPGAKRVAR